MSAERSGLLCRIPVAVRTELGPEVSLPALGAESRKPVPRLLGEAVFLQARPQSGGQQGWLAAGPPSLGRWYCPGLHWGGGGGWGDGSR